MSYDELLTAFSQFGLAAALGFLLGLEREMQNSSLGIRDFVLCALLGAISGFTASQYDNSWLILVGFVGVLALLILKYRAEFDQQKDAGVTTEFAALLTFFLGVMIMRGAVEIAVALAILALAVLFQRQALERFGDVVQTHEMQAVLLFLTITFIVLPVLPNQSLDTFLSAGLGKVTAVEAKGERVTLELYRGKEATPGEVLDLVDHDWVPLGKLEAIEVQDNRVVGRYLGQQPGDIVPGIEARSRLDLPFLQVMLSALKPYTLWLIVVLVSFISFFGYVLIKILGGRVGVGLTGLIGGLVSSTVTTLSFAKRSLETPQANNLFAMAIVLASSIMFPRLLLEIAVVNQELMRNIAAPLIAMGVAGLLVAVVVFRHSGQHPEGEGAEAVSFKNPFSLRAAISFGLLFALILMITRVATAYLGNAWLPVVALVSGLTDADAIAFSLSALHQAGLVDIDWASFNLVLGALSNTLMKLFLVFTLGHRQLFRKLLVAFLFISAVGVVTMLLYYDLGTVFA